MRHPEINLSYKEQSSRHPEEVIPTIAAIENAGSPLALLASRDLVNELWKAIAQLQILARVAENSKKGGGYSVFEGAISLELRNF